jgi:hypothetical protein
MHKRMSIGSLKRSLPSCSLRSCQKTVVSNGNTTTKRNS